MTRPRPTPWRTACSTLLLALASPALAHDPAAEEEPEPRWQGKAGLSVLATSGNTETETVGLDFRLKRLPEPWGLSFGAQFQRAEEDGVTTAERSFASLRGKRAIGERWSVFLGILGEEDEFAGLELRTVAEAGFEVAALAGEKHLLSFDVGATWTDENRLPPELDTDYVGAIAGLTYEWKISSTATLAERIVYYPNFDDSDDWRLESTTDLTVSMTSRLAIQLAYELRFRNQPIGLREDTDTSTKVSLVLNL